MLNSRGSIIDSSILGETRDFEKAEKLRTYYDQFFNKNYGKNDYPLSGLRYIISIDDVLEDFDIDDILKKEITPL